VAARVRAAAGQAEERARILRAGHDLLGASAGASVSVTSFRRRLPTVKASKFYQATNRAPGSRDAARG
jgi:hypothetical protein